MTLYFQKERDSCAIRGVRLSDEHKINQQNNVGKKGKGRNRGGPLTTKGSRRGQAREVFWEKKGEGSVDKRTVGQGRQLYKRAEKGQA